MHTLLESVSTNRDAWLRLRQDTIGASDVPTILGLNQYQSPLELWAEKTGKTPPRGDSDRLWYGREHEWIVAQLFSRRLDKHVWRPDALFRHPDIEWLTCTPDAFYSDTNCVQGLLECKSPGWRQRDDWSDTKAPNYAHCQLIAQLAIVGCGEGHCGTIIAGNVDDAFFPRFAFDESLWLSMMPTLEEFYRCMRDDEPPAVRDGDLELINKIYPAVKDEEIDLKLKCVDEQIGSLIMDLRYNMQLKALFSKDVKKFDSKVSLAKAQIRELMREHRRARYEDLRFEVKTTPRKGYSVAATEFTTLKIKSLEADAEEDFSSN